MPDLLGAPCLLDTRHPWCTADAMNNYNFLLSDGFRRQVERVNGNAVQMNITSAASDGISCSLGHVAPTPKALRRRHRHDHVKCDFNH
ncbi:MAG: hypothetical protein ACI9BW_000834 [Gammaproteobacteria bacterium]|jgi:hypothetical protein